MMSTELIFKTIELGLCLFEGYLYYIYWKHFLQARFSEKWKTVLSIGGAELGIFLVNGLRLPWANLSAEVLFHIFLVCALYTGKTGRKIFLTAVLCFIVAVSEFFVIILADMTLGSRTIYYTYDAGKACLTTFVIKLFTYLIVRMIVSFFKSGDGGEAVKIPMCFYLPPVASMFVFIGLAYSDIRFMELSVDSIFIVIGCLLVFISNILLLELYRRIMDAMENMRKMDVLNNESILKSDYYKQMEELNAQIHNMTHYLGAIRTLAIQNSNGEIADIISGWNESIYEISDEKYSSNPVINAVLNEKKALAEAKNIKCRIFVEQGFSVGKIKSVDLIGILSNLIQNAVEAAEKCEVGAVNIRLFRANDGRFAVIRVENNFKAAPVMWDGQFVTSKADKKRHGIGTRYVEKMAGEYGGWCRFSVDDDWFTATVMVPD